MTLKKSVSFSVWREVASIENRDYFAKFDLYWDENNYVLSSQSLRTHFEHYIVVHGKTYADFKYLSKDALVQLIYTESA